MTSREVHFEACYNFRDLGGYRGNDDRTVRWHKLYRSMTPEYMSEADLAAATTLDIRRVIDLRGERELSSGPLGEAPAKRIAAGPASVFESTDQLDAFMLMSPEEALPKVLEVYATFFANGLRAIAEHDEGAILFHCRLGKDRTGVFSALILKLLGVVHEDVISDYLITARSEPAMRQFILTRESEAPLREPRLVAEPVRRAAIETFLVHLESEYGGARGYFERIGVPAAILDAVVDTLLEPASS